MQGELGGLVLERVLEKSGWKKDGNIPYTKFYPRRWQSCAAGSVLKPYRMAKDDLWDSKVSLTD